jgi:phosphoserine phosphatase
VKLILTRHGHVEGIEPERFRGREDVPLTEKGVTQAAALARHIAANWRPAVIYSSPLSRCIATANAIRYLCGTKMVAIDSLNDIDYGDWQWRSYAEMREQFPDQFETWISAPWLIRFPGGESLQDMVARVANAMRLALKDHPSETVVMVGHTSINRALLLQLLDQPLSAYWRVLQSPCAINEIEIAGHTVRVLSINDTSHLAAL